LNPLRRLSLRQRLPLFLIGLTTTALVVAGLVAWGEVRTAARAALAGLASRPVTVATS
jgi:hypothetical protein